MEFKRMLFKGKGVYVAVDENGNVVEQNGRATMKYRLDDDRQYSPAVANLSEDTGAAGDLFGGVQQPAHISTKASTAPPSNARTAPDVASASTIVAYTDGGCIGNPGPAGLGYVIRYPDNTVVKKGEPLGEGTNNIAELTAILRVLQVVFDHRAPLRIHTDSSYAIGVLTQGWKAKANQTLIAEIKQALRAFSDVRLIKVKGHAGNPDNELVDTLANGAARTQQPQ